MNPPSPPPASNPSPAPVPSGEPAPAEAAVRTERRQFNDDGGSPWLWAVGILAVAAAGYGVYLWQAQRVEPPLPPPPLAQTAPPAPPPSDEAAIEHPLPAPPTDAPLPALAASDTLLLQSIIELAGNPRVQDLLQLPGIVQRIVVTIDNLPRDKAAPVNWPLKPVGGGLRISGSGETLTLDPANGARYAPYVKLLESIDVDKAVALYVRTYPLFQQAYAELGYPKRYFNDRLLQVIDHLLAAPTPSGPLRLTQPKLAYEFADAELQSLSAGQKALLRMGPEQAGRVKARLRALRDEILRNSERR